MIEIDDDKYPHQDIEDIKKGHWARYPMSFSYLLSSILSFYFCKSHANRAFEHSAFRLLPRVKPKGIVAANFIKAFSQGAFPFFVADIACG